MLVRNEGCGVMMLVRNGGLRGLASGRSERHGNGVAVEGYSRTSSVVTAFIFWTLISVGVKKIGDEYGRLPDDYIPSTIVARANSYYLISLVIPCRK